MHVLYKHLLIERGWVRRKRRGWHLGETTWLTLRTLNSFKISLFQTMVEKPSAPVLQWPRWKGQGSLWSQEASRCPSDQLSPAWDLFSPVLDVVENFFFPVSDVVENFWLLYFPSCKMQGFEVLSPPPKKWSREPRRPCRRALRGSWQEPLSTRSSQTWRKKCNFPSAAKF